MPETNGTIKFGEHLIRTPATPFEDERFSRPLVWTGGPVARVSYDAIRHLRRGGFSPRVGEALTIAGFRVRVLSWSFADQSFVVMRDGWKARAWARWYPWSGRLATFKKNIYLTLVIWGLADYERYAEIGPLWRRLKYPGKGRRASRGKK